MFNNIITREWEIKTAIRYTTHILKWLHFRTLTTPHLGEDVEQQELSFAAVGKANRAATLADAWTVARKTKQTLNHFYDNCVAWY